MERKNITELMSSLYSYRPIDLHPQCIYTCCVFRANLVLLDLVVLLDFKDSLV